MKRFKKQVLIFLIILSQTIIAVSAGLAALYLFSKKHIPENVYVGSINVGGLDTSEAGRRIENFYNDKLKNDSFTIKYDKSEMKIKYSDIDARLDIDKTIDSAMGTSGNKFVNKVDTVFSGRDRIVNPEIQFNEGKLREKLEQFAELIDKDAVDAYIYIKDNLVVKEAETLGIKLNLEYSVKLVADSLATKIDSVIEFKLGSDAAVNAIYPEFTMASYEGADEIIAQYSTEIKSVELQDSIKLASSAINRVMLRPASSKNRWKAGEFSFNKYLAREKGISETNNEGYNQVASTLYAALLMTDLKSIARTPHQSTVDFISPGMDAIVLGTKYDLKFKNTTDNPLIIFSEVKDGKIIVSIVGKKKDSELSSSIETEIEQKTDPSKVTTENKELKSGQRQMVSEGRQGVKVNVYRIIKKKDTVTDKQLLYNDTYLPVDAIEEIGPNTEWDDDSIK